MSFRCTCFIKPDLDTVVTAYLMRRKGLGHICHLAAEAPDALLDDRHVLCIECGGSGRSADADFDHHGRSILPCAAEQAWQHMGRPQELAALVRYTACVDTGAPCDAGLQDKGGMTLSALFSGMRFCNAQPAEQFRAGIALLDDVLALGCTPHDVMPLVESSSLAQRYFRAKTAARDALQAEGRRMKLYPVGRHTVGVLTANMAGVHGLLRRAGADISIAGNRPAVGEAQRWSVSVRPGLEAYIALLTPVLCGLEQGWGGPAGGGILCAPRTGSRLALHEVQACVDQVVSRVGKGA